tara:strand:- start:219 stop:737 length:519 start_codon:yes stop_codon:yes gene_type:complete
MALTQVINSGIGTTASLADSNMPAGSMIQIVQTGAIANLTTTTKGSFVDTNYTLAITPSVSSHKILISWTIPWRITGGGSITRGGWKLVRTVAGGSAVDIFNTDDYVEMMQSRGSMTQWDNVYAGEFLDSPSTTSAVTYKYQFILNNDTSITSFQAHTNTHGGAMNLKEIVA